MRVAPDPEPDAPRAVRTGPDRGELWMRFAISLAGLALMIVAVTVRGVGGMAWVEVVAIAGAFFGGSAVWSGWQLMRR